jgi:nucleoside-diphosphate-sugar epimerase
MNILVTGAIGFIAKNLIASLKNIQTGKDKTSGLTAELNIMEFTRETAPDVLEEYCASADFVFHLTTMMGTRPAIVVLMNVCRRRPTAVEEFYQKYA